MFCSKCGTQLPDESQFCPKCGAKIGEVSFEELQQQRRSFKMDNFKMDKNMARYISKFGLVLVFISFFMPLAFGTNAFQLSSATSAAADFGIEELSSISLLLYVSFITALAGLFLIVLYVLKKEVKMWMELLPLIISLVCAIIALTRIGKFYSDIGSDFGVDVNKYFGTQAGIVFLIIGYVIAFVSLILTDLSKIKKIFFSIDKPYKYLICGFILLFLFCGYILPWDNLKKLVSLPRPYNGVFSYNLSLLAFYNGIANATVGFIALILGPIAGLICGFLETVLNLIFKIGFQDVNGNYRGLEFINRIFIGGGRYYIFMYALFGISAGLCFHFMKIKNNISTKTIVVPNSIIVVFNILINHVVFSLTCKDPRVFFRARRLAGYVMTIFIKQPVPYFILIECLTMVIFTTLFVIYYKKAMNKGRV
jgi:hypothetical protein